MPRFRNTQTGSIISVSDERAARLGTGGWEPLESGDGYDAMTVDQLKDEIRRRNEGRDDDDRLPLTGTKQELVTALEADDASR